MSKGISPKVNVIEWMEFEIVDYAIVVQHVKPYATMNPHKIIACIILSS